MSRQSTATLNVTCERHGLVIVKNQHVISIPDIHPQISADLPPPQTLSPSKQCAKTSTTSPSTRNSELSYLNAMKSKFVSSARQRKCATQMRIRGKQDARTADSQATEFNTYTTLNDKTPSPRLAYKTLTINIPRGVCSLSPVRSQVHSPLHDKSY